jgi:hypothetical protein
MNFFHQKKNNTSSIMENCKCNEPAFKDDKCVICGKIENRPLSEGERKASCPIHGMKFICGPTEFICKSCTEEGWYSTAGWGGPTKHINRKTGETRKPKAIEDEDSDTPPSEQSTNNNTADNLDMV